MSLLLEFYGKLPQPRQDDDPDLLHAGMQAAMREFRDAVRERYSEGTLQRLLASGDQPTRRAAALALGLVGTMKSNPTVATALRDEDTLVRKFAADSLWEIWLRGGTTDQSWELQQAMQLTDVAEGIAALDDLIREAPDFAEVYNQRAILRFRRGDYSTAITDCESTLRLNPFHFGAAAGLGRCYVRMNKPRAALRAFKQALDIHPGLDLRDTIRELETALNDGGDAE